MLDPHYFSTLPAILPQPARVTKCQVNAHFKQLLTGTVATHLVREATIKQNDWTMLTPDEIAAILATNPT